MLSKPERNPIDVLAEEFAERYRRGERPSLTEYTRKYPELAAEIEEVFPALVVMEQLKPPDEGACTRTLFSEQQWPERIGDYRILRQVGRGGMGIVYEAEQLSLGRHVALKILPTTGLTDPVHLERFRREARTAARLHHTNIVSVFGVGEAEGVRYYAMQFIHGESIDKVLRDVRRIRAAARSLAEDDNQATVDRPASIARSLMSGFFTGGGGRVLGPAPNTTPALSGEGGGLPGQSAMDPSSDSTLSLVASDSEWEYFRSVSRVGLQLADALAYAHRQGILHRDIKPSNLLLDIQGTVWITDFGLAKSEGAEDLTHTGDIVGTIRYMAPERFEGESLPASDIYSLGVTLYEMLTLRPAFEDSNKAKLIERIARQDPPLPRKLEPRIPRDLETIVLKCIARSAGRRYATADELAEDLRRFLSDRPILARRTSWSEQTWRWCRRNPVVASLVATIAVVLTASVIALTALYLNADRQRNRAEEAEEHSRTAAIKALSGEAKARQSEANTKSVLEFFQKRVLAAAGPKGQQGGLGPGATIRAAVDQAEPTIGKSFAGEPQVEASIRQVLGHTYWYLGDYPAAIRQHERACFLRQTHLGPDHADTLKSMVSLAQDYQADGQGAAALKLYQALVPLLKTSVGADDSETLWSMRGVARSLEWAGHVSDALPLFEEVLKRAKTALGPDHPDTLIYMANLADAYRRVGRLSEAFPLFEEAIERGRDTLGPKHPDVLVTMNDLAVACREAGRLDEAAKRFDETLQLKKTVLGPEHSETLLAMMNLGDTYRLAGRPGAAILLLEEALRLRRAYQGPNFDMTLVAEGFLAAAYRDEGRIDEALALYKDTLKRQKENQGADYPFRLRFLNEAATCLIQMKSYDEAATLLRECLALRTRQDPGDWWILYTNCQLGQAFTGLQRYAEAEVLLLQAHQELIARRENIPPLYRRYIDQAAQAVVHLYEAQGKTEEAAHWRPKTGPSKPPND
jgi:serine/threonine protein kinase